MAEQLPEMSSLRRHITAGSLFNAAMLAYLLFLAVEGLATSGDLTVGEPAEGNGLALFASRPKVATMTARVPAAAPDGLQELRQTYKVLGIICRDEADRSVFVRDLTTGQERIYRVGDALNGATLTEIHPSFVVLGHGGSRLVLDLFSQDRQKLDEVAGES